MWLLSILRPLCWLALVGLATACAPTYELGLRPARSTGWFADGHEQAQVVADSVEVLLSFICYEPMRVVFEAQYRNPTHHSLVVDPAAFRYQASRQPAPAPTPGQKAKRPKPLPGAEVTAVVAAASRSQPLPPLPPRPVAAFDPEPEIKALQKQADRQAAKAAGMAFLGMFMSIATLATDVASIGRNETNETQAQYERRTALREAMVSVGTISNVAYVGHTVAAEELQARATNLQEYALRKVTLAPGQQVRGYLYFPRYDAADSLLLQAPIGSGTAPLHFVQTRRRTR